MKLKNSNIIITGAGSGFGKSMCLYFAKKNANVYALDLNLNSLNRLKEAETNINIFECDITDNHKVESTVEKIFSLNKKMNVLINNAGIMENSPLINLLDKEEPMHSVDLFENIMNVNQNGVFIVTRNVVKKMIDNRNKGVIINFSSISSYGNIGQTAYSASKASVEAMTMVWAKELGVFGIRSVAVAPGFINTDSTHNTLNKNMLSEWINKTPLKRLGQIEEVVRSIEFIIKNDFINGEVIKVNGGLRI